MIVCQKLQPKPQDAKLLGPVREGGPRNRLPLHLHHVPGHLRSHVHAPGPVQGAVSTILDWSLARAGPLHLGSFFAASSLIPVFYLNRLYDQLFATFRVHFAVSYFLGMLLFVGSSLNRVYDQLFATFRALFADSSLLFVASAHHANPNRL